MDKGLDSLGALLVPASVLGWERAWEARRTASTGAVPLTLHRAPGHRLDAHVLGVAVTDVDRLDASEGRGRNYTLGLIGPAAVAARFHLEDVLAYGPTASTRLLLSRGAVATYPALPQGVVAALADDPEPVTLAAEPLERVASDWPDTPLGDLPLFVYGTLQPGMSRWSTIAHLVEVVSPAEARGSLVGTVFDWPAASFDGTGVVYGTLVRATSAAAAVELFLAADRIEDVPRLFRRVAAPVSVDHRTVWAAAYAWNTEQGEPPGTRLSDGRWLP